MDPDQDRLLVSPDLDPNCFDTNIVFVNFFFFLTKLILKKISADDKSVKIYLACKELNAAMTLSMNTFSLHSRKSTISNQLNYPGEISSDEIFMNCLEFSM